MGQILIDTFKGKTSDHTANAAQGQAKEQAKGYTGQFKYKGEKCKEDHPSWVITHNWDYCDKNPNKKGPKGRDDRIAKRKARQEKKCASTRPYAKYDEVAILKATVAAQKKLLALKESQSKAEEMEAASEIIFDDDEDLDVQDAALQSYLLSLESQSVKLGAMAAGGAKHYTMSTGIVDSGASATFVTSEQNISNSTTHWAQLRTSNCKSCYTAHLGKTALPVGFKAAHLPALVAPSFIEDLISVAQLTAKGNMVLFTKNQCLFLGPSDTLDKGLVIGQKGKDNLYRLQYKITKP